MKQVIIMRHAKSSWADSNLSDFDRPLNKRGIQATPLMASRLVSHQLKPYLVLISAANRTRQTIELVKGSGLLKDSQLEYLDELYLASSQQISSIIQSQNNDYQSIMIVAHNPGVTHFINEFAEVYLDNLPTAGIAVINFDIENWSDLEQIYRGTNKGKLLFIEFPRMFE